MASEKTKKANDTVIHYSRLAIGVGLVPLPLIDFVLLSGIQLDMLRSLAQQYQVEFSEELGQSTIAALLGSVIPVSLSQTLTSLLKRVSGYGLLISMVSTAFFGSASTVAVGKVFIQHFESGGTLLNFDPEEVREYYRQELEKNEEEMRRSFAGVRP